MGLGVGMTANLFNGGSRRTSRVLRGLLVTAVAVPLAGLMAAPAQADTLYTPWSGYLSGWTDEYIPSSDNDCVAGRDNCLHGTLKELARIADANATSCNHNAIFSLAYLRMTQTYGWARDIPGYYQDVPFANHLDAVFASYYTDAWYAYQAVTPQTCPRHGRSPSTPPATSTVTGSGDLLLGMNAHINRDLPYVLAATGLVAPDGSSRKTDYDKDEQWLNDSTHPLLYEAAARFDPTVDDSSDPYGISDYALFQAVSGWRENAWRNAEALVSASTPDEYAMVQAKIESDATNTANLIAASYTYNGITSSTGPRDTFCAVHNGDAAPDRLRLRNAAALGLPVLSRHQINPSFLS